MLKIHGFYKAWYPTPPDFVHFNRWSKDPNLGRESLILEGFGKNKRKFIKLKKPAKSMVYVRALTYTDLHVIKRSGNF